MFDIFLGTVKSSSLCGISGISFLLRNPGGRPIIKIRKGYSVPERASSPGKPKTQGKKNRSMTLTMIRRSVLMVKGGDLSNPRAVGLF